MRIIISELSLYRWRFLIGYGAIMVSLITVLVFIGLYSPGGISDQEMKSAVISSSVKFNDIGLLSVTNLPYHILQQFSFAIFGISIISIKLPSIVLALLSAIGMILLLIKWFKPRIAVLSSIIAITTGQFIFIAQDGTPGILYLFWSVALILLAALISTGQKKFRTFYKISFCITAALSLYTPLSIYMLIAIMAAVILHPHLRYIIKQLSKPKIIIGLAIATLLLIPLIATIVKTPKFGLELLGIPSMWPNISESLADLGAEYLGFVKPGGTTLMTPFFELGSMLIIAIGAYYVFRTRETAKSYVIGLWILFLIPVMVINPGLTDITFLPLVLLLASGLNTLISYWYNLFPRNPYARISGLIPVIILITVLVLSGLDRYIYGYRYDPDISTNFSTDLRLIPKDTKQLVVSDGEIDFYKVIEKYNNQFTVTTTPTNDSFLTTRLAKQSLNAYNIEKIVTSPKANNGDRFYMYTKR